MPISILKPIHVDGITAAGDEGTTDRYGQTGGVGGMVPLGDTISQGFSCIYGAVNGRLTGGSFYRHENVMDEPAYDGGYDLLFARYKLTENMIRPPLLHTHNGRDSHRLGQGAVDLGALGYSPADAGDRYTPGHAPYSNKIRTLGAYSSGSHTRTVMAVPSAFSMGEFRAGEVKFAVFPSALPFNRHWSRGAATLSRRYNPVPPTGDTTEHFAANGSALLRGAGNMVRFFGGVRAPGWYPPTMAASGGHTVYEPWVYATYPSAYMGGLAYYNSAGWLPHTDTLVLAWNVFCAWWYQAEEGDTAAQYSALPAIKVEAFYPLPEVVVSGVLIWIP